MVPKKIWDGCLYESVEEEEKGTTCYFNDTMKTSWFHGSFSKKQGNHLVSIRRAETSQGELIMKENHVSVRTKMKFEVSTII